MTISVGDDNFSFTGTFVDGGTRLLVIVELLYGAHMQWHAMIHAAAMAAQTAAPITVRYFDTELNFSAKGADTQIEEWLFAKGC